MRRLIEWYPHDGERRFSEVTLTAIPERRIAHGRVAIVDEAQPHTLRQETVLVRFADPRWIRRSENELAQLLGEEAVRDLRSCAGLPGDYRPERLLGSTGRALADAIRVHNERLAGSLKAQITDRPPAPASARSQTWECPRNCVGMNERVAHAYDYEKQDAAEQDHDRAGARAGA